MWDYQRRLCVIKHADAWKDHKYFARIPTGKKNGNKYRYFYTKEEYQAYLKGRKTEETKKTKTSPKKTDETKKTKASPKKTEETKKTKTINGQKASLTRQKAIIQEAADRYAKYVYGDNYEVSSCLVDDETVTLYITKDKKPRRTVSIKRDLFYNDFGKSAEIDYDYGLKMPHKLDYSDYDEYSNAYEEYTKKHKLAQNDKQKKADIAAGRKPNMLDYSTTVDSFAAYNEAYTAWRHIKAGKTLGEDSHQRISTLKYGEFVDAINDGYDPFNDMSKIGKKESIEDAMYRVNPNYNQYDTNKGYEINCAFCSYAYDLRRRGYDVEARANTEWQNGTGAIVDNVWPTIRDKWYKKSSMFTKKCVGEEYVPRDETEKKKLTNKLTKELEDYGDGARGMLCVTWSGLGCGHAIAWEIVDKKLKLIDAQTGESLKMSDYVSRSSFIGYIRTDNLEPSPYVTYMMKTKKGTKKGASK